MTEIYRLDFGSGWPEERRIAMLRRGMYKPLATATNHMLVYILRLNGHVQPKVVIKDTVNWYCQLEILESARSVAKQFSRRGGECGRRLNRLLDEPRRSFLGIFDNGVLKLRKREAKARCWAVGDDSLRQNDLPLNAHWMSNAH